MAFILVNAARIEIGIKPVKGKVVGKLKAKNVIDIE